ncbi:MAG: DsbA family oxidoreductase [Saprospiraceae bacterium]
MKIEIWSDVVCPFCYIGKRKFEKALEQFQFKDQIEVQWRSFQLDPNADDNIKADIYDYLARKKGQSREWSVQMHQNVVQMAAEVGLQYNFDIAQMSNSFKAHQLIQLAKLEGKDSELEELLFKAYFTQGKNISNVETLLDLVKKAGIQNTNAEAVFRSVQFSEQIQNDIKEGEKLGLTGVPFFVFNRKYGVSGAQDPKVFLNTLQKAYENFLTEHK